MKVTRWTYWNNDKYLTIDDMTNEEFEEAGKAVAEALREKGYKFNGPYHQNGDYGCPVLDNKYVYCVSMRTWGRIMQEAYNIPNDDGLGYVIWAWGKPNNEHEVYPTGE
jgi:hypothetical protein